MTAAITTGTADRNRPSGCLLPCHPASFTLRRLPVHDPSPLSPDTAPGPVAAPCWRPLRSHRPYDPHARSARGQFWAMNVGHQTFVQVRDATHSGSKTLAPMALNHKKIGFTDEAAHMIAREASHSGMTFSAYVTEAAFARAMYDWARRGEDGADEYPQLLEAARAFLEHFRPDEDTPQVPDP